MDGYQIIAIVIVLTTLLNTVNRRLLHLPPTIGMMLAGLIVSVGVVVVGRWVPDLTGQVRSWVTSLDFNNLVLKGLLGFLLFAGARRINLQRLVARLWPISIFALGGVVLSTFIIGGVLAWLSQWLGLGLSFLECLLFGAIISPTDPIAVLAILRQVGAPKNLEMDVEGESLFNDGIGVVMFLVIARVIALPGEVSVPSVLGLFLLEAAGGIALGFAFGFIASRMIRSNQDPRTQLLLTLCIVTGGYQLADVLHASGPLAMVVSGIVVGNHEDWLEPNCRVHLDNFWDLIDELGNAVLFMLVGLELLLVAHEVLPEWRTCLLAASVAVPLVLLARWAALIGPMQVMKRMIPFDRGAMTIMTWGGLRGGLPLAMALCIPTTAAQITVDHIARSETVDRAMLLLMTYTVVVFSILVQGLTIRPLVGHYLPHPMRSDRHAGSAGESR